MSLLPEWAPGVHPLIIHFPIALLMLGVVLDAIALYWRQRPDLHLAAVLVYLMGAAGAVAAFFTGRAAADAVLLPAAAETLLTDHADWATWTAWFFGGYALIRLGMYVFYRKRVPPKGGWVLMLLLGAGGLFLVYETAEHGAQMVYEQGVGVVAVYEAAMDASPTVAVTEEGPQPDDAGGWAWRAQRPSTWASGWTWLEGSPDGVQPSIVAHPSGGEGVALTVNASPLLFLVDEPIGSFQADMVVDVTDFQGTLRFVHNVQDAQNYLFFEVDEGQVRQGRVAEGETAVDETAAVTLDGRQRLRVVSDQTHFRAYVGGKMATHGHGDAPPPGGIGLRLEGTGTLYLEGLSVTALRPTTHNH